MKEMLNDLLNDPINLLGYTNLALTLQQRFQNKKFRKEVLQILKKNQEDNKYIIDLLEGLYIKLNQDQSLTITKLQKENTPNESKKNNVIDEIEAAKIVEKQSEASVGFCLKYAKKMHSFLEENSIILSIPPNCEEYVQVNIIKAKIGINRQLYFQLENQITHEIINFNTDITKEIQYLKPVHIISYNKGNQLFIKVKIDGVVVGSEHSFMCQ